VSSSVGGFRAACHAAATDEGDSIDHGRRRRAKAIAQGAAGKAGLSPIYLDRVVADVPPDERARRNAGKRIAFGWFGGIAALGEVGTRLLRVQIEDRPAIDVIRLYKGWRRFDADEKHCHSIKQLRQECLWMND